jgi:hypothetical protein
VSLFSDDDKLRKHLPVFTYITKYCPKALVEMTKVSVVNNVRYNPDRAPADINWNRDRSKDQLGSSLRHMMESAVDGKVFEIVPPDIAAKTGITRIYVLAENAWRAVAALELEIERVQAEEKHSQLSEATRSIAASLIGAFEEPSTVPALFYEDVEVKPTVSVYTCKCGTYMVDPLGTTEYWDDRGELKSQWTDPHDIVHTAASCRPK